MIWTKENWGRYWGWDAKETGGLLVFLWVAWMTFTFKWPRVNVRAIMNMAMVGSLITCWAWFGTATWGSHGYGFASRILLGLFVTLRIGCLAAGLLPATCLRFRRALD